jgi:hypothetical protein
MFTKCDRAIGPKLIEIARNPSCQREFNYGNYGDYGN